MKDTDWRPSPCPECGSLRDAAKYPVCENKQCRIYGHLTGQNYYNPQVETNMNKPRYLWIRPNNVESPMVLVDDPVSIFRGNQFDESVDKLYALGNEVKMKVVVEPVPSYRGDKTDVINNIRTGRDWKYSASTTGNTKP